MNTDQITRISKLLSLVLRHRPGLIGISLDEEGWTDIGLLLRQVAAHGHPLSRDELDRVVATNNKQRFAIHADGQRIRASQGHSVRVMLGLEPEAPPEFLFHGTVERSLSSIRSEGLRKMQRHQVHLSADTGTARQVGGRRGSPVVLQIRSLEMHHAGYAFFRSPNGVWLTDSVPARFIDFPDPGI